MATEQPATQPEVTVREATQPEVKVREVWNYNLDDELFLIHGAIFHYRYISIDTEYPGTVFYLRDVPKEGFAAISPENQYLLMRHNVDLLRLIQLGVTLMDELGNLPTDSTGSRCVWQFNFRDFDPEVHSYNADSIKLLTSHGIQFSDNKTKGINSADFAYKFYHHVLKFKYWPRRPPLTWITFQGAYDFGFMIKILTHRDLPQNLDEFMNLVCYYFGGASYDLKLISQLHGLHGGLDKVATSMGLTRAGGDNCHQAGPDSLLTMQVFKELQKKPLKENKFMGNNHKFYGLVHRHHRPVRYN